MLLPVQHFPWAPEGAARADAHQAPPQLQDQRNVAMAIKEEESKEELAAHQNDDAVPHRINASDPD